MLYAKKRLVKLGMYDACAPSVSALSISIGIQAKKLELLVGYVANVVVCAKTAAEL